jgi:hypothetical protein
VRKLVCKQRKIRKRLSAKTDQNRGDGAGTTGTTGSPGDGEQRKPSSFMAGRRPHCA